MRCFRRILLPIAVLGLSAAALTSAADMPADVTPTKADYDRLLGKLLEPERLEPGDARWLIELARQYRERFGGDPWQDRGLSFGANRVCDIALGCWLSGDEELAYQIMREGFRRGRDEKFDPWFAAFAVASGRGERALEELESWRTAMPPGDFGLKRMHVLRALGRGEEALAAPRPESAPLSWMELAVEREDWRKAIDASVSATDDSKRRDALRHFIAILSRDPELLGRHRAAPNRTLLLLAGDEAGFARMILAGLRWADPLGEDELREMGQDAVIAVAAEARLTQALASGDPVPYETMRDYFQCPDLLPDPERSARLAMALAAASGCRHLNSQPEIETTGHRLVAAEALLNLGKGDAAFAAVRPVLESGGFDLPDSWAWGGYAPSMLAAYRQAGHLASRAWPDADAKTRLDRLAGIMGKADPVERARGMIALAEHHVASLDKKGVLQWLWLPLHDLASGGKLPDDVLAAARGVLERLAPDDRDKLRLEAFGKPLNFALTRRFDGPFDGVLSFAPAPGADLRERANDFEDPVLKSLRGRWDPQLPDFVVLDGLVALKTLLESSRRDLADPLVRSLIGRLCLDRSLAAQRVQVTLGNSSFPAGPAELFPIAAAEWKFPGEWLDAYGYACWCPDSGYSDDRKVEWAARAMARMDRFAEAARLQRIYLLRTLSPAGDDPAVYPGEVAELIQHEAMAAARSGDRESVLRNFGRHLRLVPYRPESGAAILAAWSGDEARTLGAEAHGLVEAYWAAKLLELPGSKTYEHWRDAWRKVAP